MTVPAKKKKKASTATTEANWSRESEPSRKVVEGLNRRTTKSTPVASGRTMPIPAKNRFEVFHRLMLPPVVATSGIREARKIMAAAPRTARSRMVSGPATAAPPAGVPESVVS